MRYLLIISHGSRRAQSNEEVRQLAESIARHPDNNYTGTLHAFLELAQPSISTAIDQCVASGATAIIAQPYFLTIGNHVATDIPAVLDEKRRQYPHIDIEQRDYIGKSAGIKDLVLQAALAP